MFALTMLLLQSDTNHISLTFPCLICVARSRDASCWLSCLSLSKDYSCNWCILQRTASKPICSSFDQQHYSFAKMTEVSRFHLNQPCCCRSAKSNWAGGTLLDTLIKHLDMFLLQISTWQRPLDWTLPWRLGRQCHTLGKHLIFHHWWSLKQPKKVCASVHMVSNPASEARCPISVVSPI